MYQTVRAIIVGRRRAKGRCSTSCRNIICLLRETSSLVRIVHEVARISVSGVCLLSAPDFLLATGVRKGLREGGRRRRVRLLTIVRETEIEL